MPDPASGQTSSGEEERLQALVDSSPLALVEFGLDTRIRLWNPAAERIFGWPAEEMIGRAGLPLAPPSKRGEAEELIERVRAGDELSLALEELRELARGLHPAVLTDRGLPAAVEMLAGRAPVPVDIAEVPGERLPEPVEAAAYYLIAEALTNVAKYARASAVRVRVGPGDGRVLVEVSDDGVGGADPAAGSGLRGPADRVEALGGSLEVMSPAGAGTSLRAEIPSAPGP